MPVSYNLKQGVDFPAWQWLAFLPPGPSYHGSSNVYDGSRYIYWAIQYGTTGTTASTTQLWRYDTWTNGWQFVAALTSGNQGIDLEYDFVRNVVYITIGSALTEWRYFNASLTAITLLGQTVQPLSLSAAIATVLPAAAGAGASLCMPNDVEIPAQIDTGTVAATSTATTLVDSTVPSSFGVGLVGLYVRFTSGALNGQRRVISAVPGVASLTTAAFGATPAVGDTFVVEMPSGAATVTGSSTTALGDTTAAWPANAYANSDVVITGGTGSGQRRRIASNTGTVLTLAGATAGNARTGPFTTAPDATSTYQIVPSSDFLYYMSANGGTTAWKIDVLATTPAWTAITVLPGTAAGGANFLHPLSYAPFSMTALRGNGTANVYLYNIGTNTWTTLPSYWAGEVISVGASSCLIPGKRKVFIQRDSAARTFVYDLTTGILDAAPMAPYANPAGYEGHRARYVATPSGVAFIYLMRAGGQEFFRLPVEWI